MCIKGPIHVCKVKETEKLDRTSPSKHNAPMIR